MITFQLEVCLRDHAVVKLEISTRPHFGVRRCCAAFRGNLSCLSRQAPEHWRTPKAGAGSFTETM